MSSQNSLAIVLRWRPYGDSDKIATLLTQDFGKLTGIAKGAKRSRRRFANSLEPLAKVRLHFRLRAGASLAFLESCELIRGSDVLNQPLKFAYASYLAELCDHFTAEEQPVREVFDLLEQGLSLLEVQAASSAFLRAFELQLLTLAGYEPRLDRCAGCGQATDAVEAVFLSLQQGTFLCAHCRARGEDCLEVDGQVLRQLINLKSLPVADCLGYSLRGRGPEASEVTGRLLALHLHRPLRSLKLIAQLAAS